jgi:hypothetical protein
MNYASANLKANISVHVGVGFYICAFRTRQNEPATTTNMFYHDTSMVTRLTW